MRAGVYGANTKMGTDGVRNGYNRTASAKYEQARKDGTRKGLLEFRLPPDLRDIRALLGCTQRWRGW